YTPLAQREATPPPQPVFVVDQRRGRWNRQPPPVTPGYPPRRRSPPGQQGGYFRQAPQRQMGLPQPRVRQTQDDPQYHSPQQRRQYQAPGQEEVPYDQEALDQQEAMALREPTPRRRGHWLLYVGLGMCAMLLVWQLAMLFLGWWQVSQDDLHYGRPRTFQCD